MNDEIDLDALTALEQAASPAPWAHEYEGSYIVHGDGHTIAEAGYRAADAAFIAAVRNNLPALLSALTATRAELDEAKREVHLLKHTDDGRLFLAEVERDAARAEADEAKAQLSGWRKRATRQRDEKSLWNDAALALLLQAKSVILKATRAHCADDPWRTEASRWVQHHAAFTGDDEAAGAGNGEQDTATTHTYAFSWDGDTLWLECDPCRERNGEWIVCSAEPGDTWDELVEAVADHEAAFHAAAVPAATTASEHDTASTPHTVWGHYADCTTCGAAAGKPCVRVNVQPGHYRGKPHWVRELAPASVQGAADGEAQA